MYIRFCLPKCSSQLNIPTPLLPPTSSAHPPTSKISLKFQEMISNSGRNIRYPFTASQWQELEHQALIFKYMVSGMPIPPDLLYTIRRSLDSSSLSSQLLLHQPQHVGWNCFQMGFGRKIDPEPGRCRRTDGKKWRCSKEAYPDSKYCERHMHRGRNRSRKPVEVTSNNNNTSITAPPPPTAIPISSITKNPINHHPSSPTNSLSCLTSLPQNHPFLYPHSSNRPLGTDLSSQENSATTTTTNFLLESGTYSSHAPRKSCYNSSYGQGGKEEVDQEHAFFSETSGSMRNISGSDSWQLTMGSPLSHQMKQQRSYNNSVGQNNQSGHSNNSSYLQLDDYSSSRRQQKQNHHQYLTMDQRDDQQQQPKKVMHHFFDEWPPKDNKDSWIESDEVSKIQLSISMPNSSHDFFMTRN